MTPAQAVEKQLKTFLVFKKEELPGTNSINLEIQSRIACLRENALIDLKNQCQR